MKLSVKVDYACRVLAEMGRVYASGELTQIDQLSRIEDVPVNFLAQILCELRDAGLIISKRGVQGGYALSRSPDQVNLCEIMKAIDGELIESSGNYAGRTGRRMKEIWAELRAVLEERAQEITLDSLITKTPSEMYHI
ncbi:MAG: transcriptional regulator, BadM/Rrf2 family [Verrucomicrobia bacterium]|nr:transcriptional regulator, BadM/Rrf2 family [Verrucomicrobiota bacterium]